MGNETPRPGIRPLMHEPNRLWPWVFRQHQVWVDINGSEHEIESMPFDYVANVIGFCIRRALWIRVLVDADGALDEVGDDLLGAEKEDDRLLMGSAAAWLETTALMRALRRRLERAAP